MKWLNKKVSYQDEDGYTYSATVAEHLMLVLVFAVLFAIVAVVPLFVCSK